MYTIGRESPEHDTLFYVARNRWSPEYPDAFKFETHKQAADHLANIQRMNPDNDAYQAAHVI